MAITDQDLEDQDDDGGGQGGGSGNRGQGRTRNRQGPIDLLSEENKGRAWSFLTNLVAMKANDVGQWAGGQGYGAKVLSAIEGVFGRVGTDNFVFPALATFLNEPAILKNAVRAAGLPPQVNLVIEEAVDDFLEGVRLRHRQNGRLTERDAQGAASEAHERMLVRLSSRFTYPVALDMLTPAEQAAWQQRIGNFTGERKEKFEKFREMISHPRDIRTLLLLSDDQWVPHLEQKYGSKLSSGAKSIATTVENAFKAVDQVARKVLAPPAQGADPVVKNIKKARASVKKRRFHV